MSITTVGGIQIDYENCTVTSPVKTRLGPREVELLKLLLKNIGKPIRKQDVVKELWEEENFFNERVLDVLLTRFRRYAHPVLTLTTEDGNLLVNYSS